MASIEIDDKQNPITKYGSMVHRNNHGLYFLTKKNIVSPLSERVGRWGQTGQKKSDLRQKQKKGSKKQHVHHSRV